MKQKFSINNALTFGWDIFKKYFWFLMSLLAVTFVVSFISSTASKGFGKMSLLAGVISIIAVVLGIIIQMGILKITLKFADKEEPTFDDLFSQYKLFWRYLGATILYVLIVLGGLILLVVPGIILALKYQFYRYLIIDKKMGIRESLRKSGEITQDAKWDLFLFWLVIIGLYILGALLFFVGLLAAIPITMLAQAFVYRELLKHAHHAEAAAAQ